MTAVLLAAALLATNATPAEIVANCRAMIPANVELSGRFLLRNRRGIVLKEHDYTLVRKAGATTLVVDGDKIAPGEGALLGTDVTWSDLTLDYLNWEDFAYDAEREGETVHGQVCSVIRARL